MQEWYEVLSLFKSADPNGNGQQDEEPICMASSCWKYFLTAYGIDDDPSVQFDQDDNPVVVYGYMTDAYKEFLAEMNRWYQEGLIYNMFENVPRGNVAAGKFQSGRRVERKCRPF